MIMAGIRHAWHNQLASVSATEVLNTHVPFTRGSGSSWCDEPPAFFGCRLSLSPEEMDGKAKGRVKQNSPISSFPIPGFCDWKGQDKFYLSIAQAGAWPHVSLGQDWCPQWHNVPPFPCISAQSCTCRVWSNLWMWQHRAAGGPA